MALGEALQAPVPHDGADFVVLLWFAEHAGIGHLWWGAARHWEGGKGRQAKARICAGLMAGMTL